MNFFAHLEKWPIPNTFSIPFSGPAVSYNLIASPARPADEVRTIHDWLPYLPVQKSSDVIYGIDRVAFPDQLYGHMYDIPSIAAAAQHTHDIAHIIISRAPAFASNAAGGNPNLWLLPTKELNEFHASMGINVDYVNTPVGKIKLIEEPSLDGVGFLVDSDTWRHLEHTGGVVCLRPSHNVRVQFFSPASTGGGAPKCECGASKVGSGLHSTWCPIA